jgi:hypothetical protein
LSAALLQDLLADQLADWKCKLTNGYHGVRVIVTIVAEVILWPAARCELAASCSVQDEQDTAHKGKYKHCTSQYVLGRISFDEWRNQDRSNALERLVEPSQNADPLEGDGNVRLLLKFIVSVSRKRNDRSVESLESELVHHDAGDVDGDVPSLDRSVDAPCLPNDSNRPDHGNSRSTQRAVVVLREAMASPQMRRDLVYTSTISERWC